MILFGAKWLILSYMHQEAKERLGAPLSFGIKSISSLRDKFLIPPYFVSNNFYIF